MLHSTPILVLVAALVTAPPTDDPVELRFTPERGHRTALAFQLDMRVTPLGEAWGPIAGGERLEDEWESIDGGVPTEYRLRGALHDEWLRVEADAVTRVRRTFEGLGGFSEAVDESGEVHRHGLFSLLDGRTVDLRVTESGRLRSKFADERDAEESDAALLSGQRLDAFGAWLLPPRTTGPVRPGDTWTHSTDVWSDLVEFGGEKWLVELGGDEPTSDHAALLLERVERARQNSEGEVRCRFAGTRDVDGETLAVIEVEVELETGIELRYDDEIDPRRPLLRSESVEDVTTAKGECLWRLAAGLPRSIHLDVTVLDTTTIVETAEEIDEEPYSVEYESVSRSEGTLRLDWAER